MSKALLVIDMQEAYVGERCASYLKCVAKGCE